MNPEARIEIRDTEHFFYRLDLFQALEKHAASRQDIWKPNVRNDKTVARHGSKAKSGH